MKIDLDKLENTCNNFLKEGIGIDPKRCLEVIAQLRADESQLKAAQEQVAVGYLYPVDFEKLQNEECCVDLYSVPVGCPDGESTVKLYAAPVPADHIPDGFNLVPIERSYDMRAAALLHYNTAKSNGKDLDDALDAAWRATIEKAYRPDPLDATASPEHIPDAGKKADDTPAAAVPEQTKLAVWYGSMPESNGRKNWTAVLHKDGDDGFDIFTDGHTIDRSEYPDRVKYAADCVRWLIGELPEKPFILDYDADKCSDYEPVPSPRITEGETLEIFLPEIISVVSELIDLMRGVIEGDYAPDSFTTQPAERLLRKLNAGQSDHIAEAGKMIDPAVHGVAELAKALELALEYWGHRQKRYKNRRPQWVVAAESALSAHHSVDANKMVEGGAQ